MNSTSLCICNRSCNDVKRWIFKRTEDVNRFLIEILGEPNMRITGTNLPDLLQEFQKANTSAGPGSGSGSYPDPGSGSDPGSRPSFSGRLKSPPKKDSDL